MKCKRQYLIVSIIFLAVTFLIAGKTLVNNYKELINITKNVISSSIFNIDDNFEEFINKTNSIYENNLSCKNYFVEIYGTTQKIINKKLINDVKTGYILKDEKGFLHFPSYVSDTTKTANKLIEIENYLTKQNIPLCFVLALSKDIDGFTEFKKGIDIYANSKTNYENFISVLKNSNINYINLNSSKYLNNIDLNNAFYKTDHHWQTKTSFWASKQIIKSINNTYGFNIDNDGFNSNLDNYNVEILENSFLGSLGKRMGIVYSGVDDYTLIIPDFDTSLKLYKGYNQTLIKEGSFYDVIIDKEKSNVNNPINTNRYASYFGGDDDFITIENTKADNSYKILIIKDSYALPVAAFMSLSVNKLTMIDLRLTKEQSIKNYIEENDYDLILFLYGIGSICSEDMFDIK